jgi:hypothetical protein
MSENKAVDPYEKPEGYIPPDPKTGKGMWIFAAFLAALAIGGYLFYQAGSNDIEQARQDCISKNLELERTLNEIRDGLGLSTDGALQRAIDRCDGKDPS